jgi:hypothetical protein
MTPLGCVVLQYCTYNTIHKMLQRESGIECSRRRATCDALCGAGNDPYSVTSGRGGVLGHPVKNCSPFGLPSRSTNFQRLTPRLNDLHLDSTGCGERGSLRSLDGRMRPSPHDLGRTLRLCSGQAASAPTRDSIGPGVADFRLWLLLRLLWNGASSLGRVALWRWWHSSSCRVLE